jgi:Delta7-sterol 5-desaturase
LAFFGIIFARYLILAGATHWFLYGISGNETDSVASTDPQINQSLWPSIQRDIKLSIISSVIFALSAATVITAYQSGATRLYTDINQYPLWYLAASYITMLVLQDTYFYFLHRLFHHPQLFRWWHQGHHKSPQPTPWTSFAFDPPEAIAQAALLVGLVFIIPLHFITVIAVLSTMTVWAVVNHLGLDRLPLNFPHHWFGRWFTGAAHHAIHHRQYSLHYGLYFTFWDRLLGTQSPSYDREFVSLSIEREDVK